MGVPLYKSKNAILIAPNFLSHCGVRLVSLVVGFSENLTRYLHKSFEVLSIQKSRISPTIQCKPMLCPCDFVNYQ